MGPRALTRNPVIGFESPESITDFNATTYTYRVSSRLRRAESSAPASLWICGQHKSVAHNPTGPTAAADNLNDLEISSIRATPGSPLKAALKVTRHGRYYPSAIFTRVRTAVHSRRFKF